MPERRLFVCTNQKSGIGEDVAKALKKELKAQGVKTMLADGQKLHTRIQTCSCLDRCEHCKKGPGAALVVYPDEIYYNDVQPRQAARIIEALAASRPGSAKK
ncbi:(2Fe-2S) ferredoxin domain-containing protein [Hymenobacter baengnokdamensis]|uniref:(2Fe-2S) ferredoxin domain-containing protein n=1 Tax=Hymenobacter baengnokdamensis TaxID=2615203 RepID=UPI001246A66D|nr:(2Fe-2S) ferredoxin domain-containing protein [Hymenobacter baengnokdamensis]